MEETKIYRGDRKHLRRMIRFQAKKQGYKESKAVNTIWGKYQDKKFGEFGHIRNKARSTHPKNRWANRYEMFMRGGK